MKYLTRYIFEKLVNAQVKNLKAIYTVEPEKLIFQVPAGYSESDVQTYIGDRFLPELPGDEKVGRRRFGINYNNIDDAYFEYDSFEKLINFKDKYDIEWDAKFDSTKKSPEFDYVQLTNLKYIILFDVFSIKKEESDDVKNILEKIFDATESNSANEYPLQIKFDIEQTEFSEI